jgi:acyl-coenzyme A synthetase/AMP-(fatty) acid ligase
MGRRDPVAVYVTSAADVLLNFLALTWLGAIPALMNGSMPTEIAVEYIRRLRAVGVILDADHAGLAALDLGAPILGDAAETGTGDPSRAPAHYRHHPGDPVAITHSSGTTRMPAAVVHSHQSLFAAVRAVRLTEPRQHGPVRELSAFPQAHTAGIIILNEALCNGYELLCLSEQGGTFARSGEAIIDAIERWRPTAVYGFAVTWAELARYDLTARDVSSVRFWSNSGDCAHEAHIRRLVAVGSHHAYSKDGIVSLPGSRFNDTLGSTEMGYGGFGISHYPDSERYNRCVGKPQPFAEIILVDPRTGQEVPAGEVGMVAMKSPTLALGYWNDSVNTFRTRLNGYYLTGDLMYRDEDGYFYHVDRASDAVDLGGGNWLYTALSEERILKHCPDVRDCTVLAARGDDGKLAAEVLLLLAADADPARDREGGVRAALGEVSAAVPLRIVTIPDDEIVVGPTGKVRKFLMRERLLASTGASPAEGSG